PRQGADVCPYDVVGAAVEGQVRAHGDREAGLGRSGLAGNVGVAGAVHGHAVGIVVARASDVTAVDEGRARGIHLRYEGVVAAARAVVSQVRAHGHRERGFGGLGPADNVGVAGAVHRHTGGNVSERASDIAAIRQDDTVQEERLAEVVGADAEAKATRAVRLLRLERVGRLDLRA